MTPEQESKIRERVKKPGAHWCVAKSDRATLLAAYDALKEELAVSQEGFAASERTVDRLKSENETLRARVGEIRKDRDAWKEACGDANKSLNFWKSKTA